jgi:signal transduction histidine kinase
VTIPSAGLVDRRHTLTDRRHTVVVAEDAQRIGHLARELQRNALELEGQSHSLRGTVQALEAANEELDRRTSEIAAARAVADAATARLTRLQRITAALSNTVTQDGVCETVLREAIVALECEAGAVVVAAAAHDTCTLLREAGPLDPLLRSFERAQPPTAIARGPYVDAALNGVPVYLESFEEMTARYPGFRKAGPRASHGALGAWIFLPLDIGGRAMGALAFGFHGPRKFTRLDRDFAETVSRYCAQALDRVRLRTTAAAALADADDARLVAEHANNAKTLFLRSMSHELRTPLAAIAGYTEILELGLHGAVNPAQLVDLGRIKRASSYLLRLINDVLTVARSEGAARLEVMPIAIRSALAEVEGLCALQAASKGLTLTRTEPARGLRVLSDPERLQQILLNLITNAIKFTAAGGVVVDCVEDDAMVRVRVTDTGPGIAPPDLARVFEPFVQIDPHLTCATQRGVGLGLSISRELARGMGGSLTVESEIGVGSTFMLALPRAVA